MTEGGGGRSDDDTKYEGRKKRNTENGKTLCASELGNWVSHPTPLTIYHDLCNTLESREREGGSLLFYDGQFWPYACLCACSSVHTKVANRFAKRPK